MGAVLHTLNIRLGSTDLVYIINHAQDRIIFAEKVDYSEHMSRHLLADIFLDTYPYNAHATANDSLWAGCPVVTLCGDTFVSRVGASLLKNTGLSELVTYSLEKYRGLCI